MFFRSVHHHVRCGHSLKGQNLLVKAFSLNMYWGQQHHQPCGLLNRQGSPFVNLVALCLLELFWVSVLLEFCWRIWPSDSLHSQCSEEVRGFERPFCCGSLGIGFRESFVLGSISSTGNAVCTSNTTLSQAYIQLCRIVKKKQNICRSQMLQVHDINVL